MHWKQLKRRVLSLNRPPTGHDTVQYMVVSAVNLFFFFFSPLLLLCSFVSSWLLLRQASGWTVQQSRIWANILWHPSQTPCVPNRLLGLWRVWSLPYIYLRTGEPKSTLFQISNIMAGGWKEKIRTLSLGRNCACTTLIWAISVWAKNNGNKLLTPR